MSSVTYPIDPTGTNANNLVQGEPHALPGGGIRVIALNFGAFFVNSLRVVDLATNQALTAAQFYTTWRYKVPTSKYKKDVCGLIVVTDATVSGSVLVDYQVVGGPYSAKEIDAVNVIVQRVTKLRPLAWGDLLPRPPVLTMRDFTDDEFGFERMENALDAVARTLVNGSVVTQDAVMDYAHTSATPYLAGTPSSITQAVANHVANPDDHSYYLKKSELPAILPAIYAAVRRPKNVSPAGQATGVVVKPTLIADTYHALYGVPQAQMRVQVAVVNDFSTTVLDQTINAAVTQFTLATNLSRTTKYYWRVCYQSTEGDWSPWSLPTTFTTA